MGSGLDLTQGYYDISPMVSEKSAVFPGDSSFRRKVALDFTKSDSLVLSSIESTVHIGAHADAPSHYHPYGRGIDAQDLLPYLGPCQVVSVTVPPRQRIFPQDLQGTRILAERVLFRTDSFPDPDRWTDEFNSLSPELLDYLAAEKVKLVGIDTPSIDPSDSKDLPAHAAIFRAGMRNLEGLQLAGVPDGVYTLVALPLRLKDADASPVRAILVKGR